MPAPSKRDKQSAKRFEQKRGERTNLRTVSKSFYKALEAGDLEKAREVRNRAQKTFNSAASRGIIHENKASRKVSRLARQVNKLASSQRISSTESE